MQCKLTLHISPCRAATLVRRTKGERRGARSHPLRCDRQRWYGGAWGWGHGSQRSQQLQLQLLPRTEWTRPEPLHPAHSMTLAVSLILFSVSTSPSLFVQYLLWTDLCTPLLDLSLCLFNSLFSCLLHDLRECREMAAHKTDETNKKNRTRHAEHNSFDQFGFFLYPL